MPLDNCRVSSFLKNGPTRNYLVTDFTLTVEILGIYNASIQGIFKSLSLVRSVFIVFIMMFTNTLDFQEPLIATIPGIIDFKINLIIKLFFRIEHENEHLLIGRSLIGSYECEIVSEKPSDAEDLLGLFLLLGLVLLALLGEGDD